jgi:DNA-directed RNA polymerase specialized sigma subunit
VNGYIAKQAKTFNYETIFTSYINKVVIINDCLEIHLNIRKLKSYLEDTLKIHIENITNDCHVISTDFKLQKSYRGAIIEKPDSDKSDPLDFPPQQLKNLVKGIVWRDEHFSGLSMKEIAERENVSKAHVGQIIMRSMDTLMSI